MNEEDKVIFEHGETIFKTIVDEIGKFPITDISKAKEFFELLMSKTKGWVILDFLDAQYWDCIQKVEVDEESGLVFLYWHLPEKDKLMKEMRTWVIPGDVNGLVFRFNQIESLGSEEYPVFALQGYTYYSSEIEKLMSKDGYEIKWKDNKTEFFSYEILRAKNNQTEYFRVLNTPLTFGWILAKNYNLKSQKSSNFLYQHNLKRIDNKLDSVNNTLLSLRSQNLSKEEFESAIKVQGNAMRSCAEAMFKILYSFKKDDINYVINKDNYNKIELGDVVKPAKLVFCKESDSQNLNKIVTLSNDLSHDSGTPVKIEDAIILNALLKTYLYGILYELNLTKRF